MSSISSSHSYTSASRGLHEESSNAMLETEQHAAAARVTTAAGAAGLFSAVKTGAVKAFSVVTTVAAAVFVSVRQRYSLEEFCRELAAGFKVQEENNRRAS